MPIFHAKTIGRSIVILTPDAVGGVGNIMTFNPVDDSLSFDPTFQFLSGSQITKSPSGTGVALLELRDSSDNPKVYLDYSELAGEVQLQAVDDNLELKAPNGEVTVDKDPGVALGVATKQYVDAQGGATDLDGLSDVTIVTPAIQHFLANDGAGQFVNRLIVEADISDFGSYSVVGHTHTESDITDLGNYSVVGHTHTESDITDLGAYITAVVEDTSPQLGGSLDTNGKVVHFGTSEQTLNIQGAAVDLSISLHWTLNCDGVTDPMTATFTTPPGPTAGTVIVKQGASPIDINWAGPTILWYGTEPTWNDAGEANKSRIVSWRWDGTILHLLASQLSA